MKKIGVIGCGGMIGPIICNYLLHEDVEIIGGQRSKPDFSKYPENFKWKHLDINNDDELLDFAVSVTLCSIVQVPHIFCLKRWHLLQQGQVQCMLMSQMH